MKIQELKNSKIICDPSKAYDERVPYYYTVAPSKTVSQTDVVKRNKHIEQKPVDTRTDDQKFKDFVRDFLNS